ncbi:MAG: GNAT family N-acetyltransferase [Clostridiales bacterium]|nr:GNAT family N-acetyltransferase [Clostridiales bacterium]
MKIIDLESKHKDNYFHCLEEWSDEMKDAGDSKEKWYEKMKDRGLRVKLAEDDQGRICGMIQYVPSEYSFVDTAGFYIVKCIWVYGYKEGMGNQQKKGIGTQLIEAAEQDCRELDTNGLLVWGISMPFFMRASWFKKHGFKKIDKDNIRILLWKPFKEGVIPPKLVKKKKKLELIEGKVTVQAFVNGWCPASNIVYERMKKISEEFKEYIVFEYYDTSNKEVFDEWGVLDAVYLDGKVVQKGAPPSYEKLYSKVAKKVSRLK